MEISALSKEYVRVPVSATEGGVRVDPTADVVQMAFPVTGVAPVGGDWKSASWESDATTFYARCLVGPGGTVALVAGSYDVWVKVTDSPEIPAKKAGRLAVTA